MVIAYERSENENYKFFINSFYGLGWIDTSRKALTT